MATKIKKKVVKWQYQANDDIWQWKHHNTTHRSVSEAFRDATYATAIQRPKSEWEDMIEFLSGTVFMLPMIAFALYIFYLVAVATN